MLGFQLDFFSPLPLAQALAALKLNQLSRLGYASLLTLFFCSEKNKKKFNPFFDKVVVTTISPPPSASL